MKKYFGINFVFDHHRVDEIIERCIRENRTGYVCALDGNNFSTAQRLSEHLEVINNSIVSNCDSTWLPIIINMMYGTNYANYCASDLFFNFIKKCRYKQFFLGASREVLDGLKREMSKLDPAIANMRFEELPYCDIDDFDYKGIAAMINEEAPDIVWISLGAPKQEQFMYRLKPYLKRGVMFGVGAIFNFYSGLDNVPKRAPKWMIKLGLEWLHRLIIEPAKQSKRVSLILCELPKAIKKEYARKKLTQSK